MHGNVSRYLYIDSAEVIDIGANEAAGTPVGFLAMEFYRYRHTRYVYISSAKVIAFGAGAFLERTPVEFDVRAFYRRRYKGDFNIDIAEVIAVSWFLPRREIPRTDLHAGSRGGSP